MPLGRMGLAWAEDWADELTLTLVACLMTTSESESADNPELTICTGIAW